MATLTHTELAILALEARFPRHTSEKQGAMLSELGLRPPRYYQLLNSLAVNKTALEGHAEVLGRYVRGSESRTLLRATRRVA